MRADAECPSAFWKLSSLPCSLIRRAVLPVFSMKQFYRVLIIFACLGSAFAAEDAPSMLPKDFGGWHMQAAAKRSASPADADAANAGLLKEYGFKNFESAAYT